MINSHSGHVPCGANLTAAPLVSDQVSAERQTQWRN